MSNHNFSFSDAVTKTKENTMVQMPNLVNVEEFNDHIMIQKFYAILEGTDYTNLSDYVYENIYRLLDLGVLEKNVKALSIILNDKFLSCMNNLTVCKIDLSSGDYHHKMNRIAHDYIRMVDHNIFIQNLLLSIVFNTNTKITKTLMGFNLTKDQACQLVCARYSTATRMRVNCKRLVRMIQSMPSSIMTEQNIVNIFDKTCTESVTELFIGVMYDSYHTFLSSEEEYVYSTVNLSVLDVLESLPLNGIYKVLSTYLSLSGEKKPRFLLKSINIGDYPRINQTIDTLEYNGIMVY